jgi:hypothetical protein
MVFNSFKDLKKKLFTKEENLQRLDAMLCVSTGVGSRSTAFSSVLRN